MLSRVCSQSILADTRGYHSTVWSAKDTKKAAQEPLSKVKLLALAIVLIHPSDHSADSPPHKATSLGRSCGQVVKSCPEPIADSRPTLPALPGEVSERLVRIGHTVGIFPLGHRCTFTAVSSEDLLSQLVGCGAALFATNGF